MKPKLGSIVECEFLDHVEDGGDPYKFLVWGKIAKVGRKHFEIISWAHADPDVETQASNEKRWSIVKSTIIRISVLQPATTQT